MRGRVEGIGVWVQAFYFLQGVLGFRGWGPGRMDGPWDVWKGASPPFDAGAIRQWWLTLHGLCVGSEGRKGRWGTPTMSLYIRIKHRE